jgi:alpha-1,6-mannosyltransferase
MAEDVGAQPDEELSRRDRRGDALWLGLGGACLLVILRHWLWLLDSRLDALLVFLLSAVAAFLVYGVFVLDAARGRTRDGRPELLTIITVAVALRVVALCAEPLYSDSVRRFLWDGHVLANGYNPYVAAPHNPGVAHLRGGVHGSIPYSDEGAFSPPLTVLACGLAAVLSPDSPLAIKLIATVFDLLTLWPIILLLGTLGRPRILCIVYAWNPLVIKEFANSGHLDSVAIFFLIMGLAMVLRGRSLAASVCWGLSAGAKLFAVLMLWLAWPRVRWRGVLITGLVCAAVFLPFMFAGKDGVRGLMTFSLGNGFNSGLYWFVTRLVSHAMNDPVAAQKVSRAILAAIVGLAIYTLDPTDVPGREIVRRTGILIAGLLLISPIVNPWYVCWLVPFLCLIVSPTWITFSGLVMLSYVAFAQAPWANEARVVEYVVLWGMLLREGLRPEGRDEALIRLGPGD